MRKQRHLADSDWVGKDPRGLSLGGRYSPADSDWVGKAPRGRSLGGRYTQPYSDCVILSRFSTSVQKKFADPNWVGKKKTCHITFGIYNVFGNFQEFSFPLGIYNVRYIGCGQCIF